MSERPKITIKTHPFGPATIYECPFCAFDSSRKGVLKAHIWAAHGKVTERMAEQAKQLAISPTIVGADGEPAVHELPPEVAMLEQRLADVRAAVEAVEAPDKMTAAAAAIPAPAEEPVQQIQIEES